MDQTLQNNTMYCSHCCRGFYVPASAAAAPMERH